MIYASVYKVICAGVQDRAH